MQQFKWKYINKMKIPFKNALEVELMLATGHLQKKKNTVWILWKKEIIYAVSFKLNLFYFIESIIYL